MPMTFMQASEFFATKAAEVKEAMPEMAFLGAQIVEKEAKDELGHYQSAIGFYPTWAQLSKYTQEKRERLGFSADEPLKMTGELQNSIQTIVQENEVLVGTQIPYAGLLEHGDARIPPRPFLGRAGFVKQDEILELQAEILGNILND